MAKKVLVPLDSSKLAECTLSHVKDLAKVGVVGEITLLNVVVPPITFGEEGYAVTLNVIDLKDEQLAASANYLAGLKSSLSAEGIKVKTATIEGQNIAYAITDYAEKNRIEMIVIATHGYTGLKKLFLGSVASGVVQQSNVPVYLIRPEACHV